MPYNQLVFIGVKTIAVKVAITKSGISYRRLLMVSVSPALIENRAFFYSGHIGDFIGLLTLTWAPFMPKLSRYRS